MMALQVHFAKLNCIETEDAGADECIVRWNNHEIWRGDMKGGRVRDLNSFVLMPQEGFGVVSLTDEDSPDEDDHLGAHTIRKDELNQGWHRANFLADEANYFLDYEVFEA
ncbi:hypothetical protein [Streptomyces sp. NPDC005407]|uniref:hypothetical protein n=1 Tax=Streptomyces sp. NPDC005407 TaxID=3155340 RepID=UPI0033B96EA9